MKSAAESPSEGLPLDFLRRPLREGDYVFSYTNLYKVVSIPKSIPKSGFAHCKIKLVNPSSTTIAVSRNSSVLLLVSQDEISHYILKHGPLNSLPST